MAALGRSLIGAHRPPSGRLLSFWSTGSRERGEGSVVEACGFSPPEACGIFLDQGLNFCPLHWKADS